MLSFQLKQALAKFRSALLNAGVLMSALEAVGTIAAPKLSECFEQLSKGKIGLGTVMQAANEVAAFAGGSVDNLGHGDSGAAAGGGVLSPADAALSLSGEDTALLVLNSMRMAHRLEMISEKATEKANAKHQGLMPESAPAVVSMCSELDEIEQLMGQLHKKSVSGVLQSREEAIESEVHRMDVLAGHMHTLAMLQDQKLAPSVVNESIQKMASEASHLKALQGTFKMEEQVSKFSILAANSQF